jgi:hypothetical protein
VIKSKQWWLICTLCVVYHLFLIQSFLC